MVLVVTETKSPSQKIREPGDVALYRRLKDVCCPGGRVEFEGVGGIGNIFNYKIIKALHETYRPSKIVIVIDEKGYEDQYSIKNKAVRLFKSWTLNCRLCLVVVRPDMPGLMEKLLSEDKVESFREQCKKSEVLAPGKFVQYLDQKACKNPIVSLYIQTIRCTRCEKP